MVSQAENQNDADGVQEDGTEASPSEAPELESLLKEYEGGTETPVTTEPKAETKPEPTPNADISNFAKAVKPVVDYVNEVKAEKQQERFDADLKGIMTFFSEADELKELPDKLKRGFLEAHAQEDPDFKTAFENRAKNPKAWETARESARDAFTELVAELPNSQVRTDVEAAKAAVDGTSEDKPASEEGPSPVKKMAMSDYEWRQYKEEQSQLAEAS
ncbi:hypothetical protein LCGC14_1049440 [marine sediment metagenome]|uniref:Uncharacterized protein n=1 Tax=marine sediment metagenome TaxID=412755 RepID=A0A0F9Q7C8_9ZZZZ